MKRHFKHMLYRKMDEHLNTLHSTKIAEDSQEKQK